MRLLVGRIGKAHGILGEATIEVRTDDAATRFALGAVVETDTGKSLTVDSVRVHNGILLLGFEGISSRNDIEALRDTFAALHRVPGRHVQGYDRLLMVHVLSGQHVLSYSQRDLARHVHGVSGELYFRDWKRIQGLLPVQHRLHSQGRGM